MTTKDQADETIIIVIIIKIIITAFAPAKPNKTREEMQVVLTRVSNANNVVSTRKVQAAHLNPET